MAGLGARLFPAFSKLTSEQVNGYLMDQTIMRFATTSARDAAFGGAGEPTLAEGMSCYIDNLNTLQTYDGSNWVTTNNLNFPYQNPTGLELITPTSVSGTGVSLSGAVVNFSSSTTGFVNGIFSATYRNYLGIWDTDSNVGGNSLRWRLSAAGSAFGGGYTTVGMVSAVSGGTGSITAVSGEQAVSTGIIGSFGAAGSSIGGGRFEIISPFIAISTQVIGTSAANITNSGNNFYTGAAMHYTSASGDGLEISTNGTNWNGRIRFYGYRQ